MSSDGKKYRVAILGASGYTGAELVRLLACHPNCEIVLLSADRKAGQSMTDVFPHLEIAGLPGLISLEEVEWGGIEVDVVFCALPHGTTQPVIKGLFHATGHSLIEEMVVETTEDLVAAVRGAPKVIDLSADFRFADTATYEEIYGEVHEAPNLQKIAIYGLTEFARDSLKNASLVACPGCFPTATLLPLRPLLEEGLIDAGDIIIDSKTGITGAGRSLKETNLFAEVQEGVHAYGIGTHRHGPEIDKELASLAETDMNVSFTPHLIPMNRGILATHYVRLTGGAQFSDLREALIARYGEEPFIRVLPEGMSPATRQVRGSNYCTINAFADRVPDRAIVVAAIDNLVKGASGQAIQNMNIMLGLPETAGVEQHPLFP